VDRFDHHIINNIGRDVRVQDAYIVFVREAQGDKIESIDSLWVSLYGAQRRVKEINNTLHDFCDSVAEYKYMSISQEISE
jgi:hypothetical protein